MFSVKQKREIAKKILKDTNHPELPKTEIKFHLHVQGAEGWSWADIQNNGAIPDLIYKQPIAQEYVEDMADEIVSIDDDADVVFGSEIVSIEVV